MAKKYKANLLGILTGVMLGFAFPPLPVSYFAFVAFIPLIFALEERKDSKVFLLLYTTFFVYNLITNWWIGSWQTEADPFLMLSGIVIAIVHPFFFLVPIYIYLSIRKRYNLSMALWLFPFIWTSFEWLHSVGDLSYPWLSVGYTQIYNHLWVQFADISGVWGISFVIVLSNVIIARIIFIYLAKAADNIRNMVDVKKRRFLNSLRVTRMFIAAALLIILPYVYGIIRVQDFKYQKQVKSYKTLTIGIIQPAINPWAKWQNSVREQIELHIHIQDSLKQANSGIDLMLWSETAIPFLDFNFNSDHHFDFLERWSSQNNASIITGLADVHLYKKEEKIPISAKLLTGTKNTYYDSYNAAMIINPYKIDNEPVQIYHKMHLTPFSERLPFAEYIAFARGWLEWGVGISSWQKGAEQFPLLFRHGEDSVKAGTVICIESIYPDFTRKYIEQGAKFLVVITNDAWFDHTFGPEQHFVISQMRAIETRRYIARCANSGLSGFISPTGKRLKLLPHYKTVGDAMALPMLNEVSLYVKIGDVLPYFCSILTVFFLVFGFFRKKAK